MTEQNKMAAAEAIFFASGEPLAAERICEALETELEETLMIIGALEEKYESAESGIRLIKLEDSYQLISKREYASYIRTALENPKASNLSNAAMEVLAIAAYNQPVTKSFVEHVRGVDSSSVVNTLVEKGLLEEAGRLDVPGKPICYKTTANFLRAFGFGGISELPPLPNDDEALRETEDISREITEDKKEEESD